LDARYLATVVRDEKRDSQPRVCGPLISPDGLLRQT
jgi:hypothetical protein